MSSGRNPVGRAGTPADIVAATMLLIGNGYLTGAAVHVDGGGRFA
ncbi:hypothetical protein QRX60_23290 [Amycolatopsis mongoliensis]|uniref:Uncharacterized protein n=1 Tax=Amycolatopsis mongoliensis TaxID=715475 RepID=A0A9Y2NLZ0_9PSEU|nr:hypothetical protein [Amycolatopsis sp. 4-36]WIY06629.1 hypothetical protein QRX60_23290 [Amycolatopsis sp. 4-36]